MADGKIRGAFNDEQFEAFCAELQKLPAKERTLEGISALFAARTGIRASVMAAKSFREGPFSRYLEKLNRGRETREALCAAAGSGVHPLDAIEEAAVIELQDHLTEADTIDVEWLGKQLVKLRTSISLREDARRKQTDLDRRLRESQAKIEIAEQREKILREQVAVLERERKEWEEKRSQVSAQIKRAKAAPAASADDVRAAAVAEIDRIMGITPKAKQ